MNQNSVFRANARAQLGGNIFNEVWLMALVVCLVQSIVLSLAGSIMIGVILVGGLLSYGACHVFLQMVRSQKTKPEISDLFTGSDQFLSLLISHSSLLTSHLLLNLRAYLRKVCLHTFCISLFDDLQQLLELPTYVLYLAWCTWVEEDFL